MTTVLIDGNNILSRAAFAATSSRRRGGWDMSVGEVSTGALHLFAQMLSKYVRMIGPEKVMVMWDAGHTMRDEVYPEYKANRVKRTDDGDHDHFVLAKEFCQLAGIPQKSVQGWEADDLISAAARQSYHRVAIVSGDKDLMQLISPAYTSLGITIPEIVQYRVPDDEPWTYERYIEHYRYKPTQTPMMMALVGDTSDGIPGVVGIGPKKALKLLEENQWQWEAVLTALGPERAAQARVAMTLVDLRDIEYPDALWAGLHDESIPDWEPTDITQDGQPMAKMGQVISLQRFLDRWQLKTIKERLADRTFWTEPISKPPPSEDAFEGLNF